MLSHRRRVLLTGAQGFTGRYLSRELEKQGHEVFGTVFQETARNKNFKNVDISNFGQTSGFIQEVRPDCVVHLAAISTVQHENTSEIYRTNVDATKNLLLGIRSLDYKLESIILASSANVYGNSQNEYLSESDTPNPSNDYAKSKWQMESMALEEFSDLGITITRPFNYTGAGQSDHFLIPKIVAHFAKMKTSISLGDTEVIRDFSDVRTVAWAYAQLCLKPAPGEVINICSGRGISVSEVISTLENLTSLKMKTEVEVQLKRQHEVQRLVGNPTKMDMHLGMRKDIDFEETLKWMIESSQNQSNSIEN